MATLDSNTQTPDQELKYFPRISESADKSADCVTSSPQDGGAVISEAKTTSSSRQSDAMISSLDTDSSI